LGLKLMPDGDEGDKMIRAEKRDRGFLQIEVNECKGCGLCIQACPQNVIDLNEHLNHYGYRTASYAGAGCTGCGICFMACPEPGAITVLRLISRKIVVEQCLHEEPEEALVCASN
jgi:2-oxoglutarate ferredoxin oxidoreductase subunit delta